MQIAVGGRSWSTLAWIFLSVCCLNCEVSNLQAPEPVTAFAASDEPADSGKAMELDVPDIVRPSGLSKSQSGRVTLTATAPSRPVHRRSKSDPGRYGQHYEQLKAKHSPGDVAKDDKNQEILKRLDLITVEIQRLKSLPRHDGAQPSMPNVESATTAGVLTAAEKQRVLPNGPLEAIATEILVEAKGDLEPKHDSGTIQNDHASAIKEVEGPVGSHVAPAPASPLPSPLSPSPPPLLQSTDDESQKGAKKAAWIPQAEAANQSVDPSIASTMTTTNGWKVGPTVASSNRSYALVIFGIVAGVVVVALLAAVFILRLYWFN
jgi:hypothetical protein